MAIFIPEVFTDALRTDFLGKLVLGGLVQKFDNLKGQPGNIANLPYYNYAGDAAIVAAGVAATAETLAGSSIQAEVQKAVKAFGVTDEDMTQGVGVLEQVRLQIAEALAAAVDTSLMTALLTATNKVGDGTKVIERDNIVDAQAKLGDKAEGAVLMIHSKQLADIYKDANFVSAAVLGAPIMVGGIAAVGRFYGMPVIVSDRVNKTEAGVYTAVCFKPEAAVLGYKRDGMVEEGRDALKGLTNIVGNVHFAAALAKPAYVCLIETI